VGEERIVLENHAEPPSYRIDPGDVFPLDPHASGVGHLEPRQQPQGRGLAAPAGAQQSEHFATLEREREMVHGHRAVEALGEALEAQECHCSPLTAHLSLFPVPRTCWSQYLIHSGP
jgi:hypothetical protein